MHINNRPLSQSEILALLPCKPKVKRTRLSKSEKIKLAALAVAGRAQ